ncbi:hypothetical protein Hamer_G007338 [Homarus americanus]|uniref:Uncharacterized protein n=1 Tax=Homarus americanus TaxID=6706 RepID=A0A8J5MS85_HOMAM|nr:hypothetical protein Hamer_G007338 [Homarus americanus]
MTHSVHSGRGSKGVGGGVMEDGASHAPVAARVVSASSTPRKANSLPGVGGRRRATAPTAVAAVTVRSLPRDEHFFAVELRKRNIKKKNLHYRLHHRHLRAKTR